MCSVRGGKRYFAILFFARSWPRAFCVWGLDILDRVGLNGGIWHFYQRSWRYALSLIHCNKSIPELFCYTGIVRIKDKGLMWLAHHLQVRRGHYKCITQKIVIICPTL